jgi:hypothetical protein
MPGSRPGAATENYNDGCNHVRTQCSAQNAKGISLYLESRAGAWISGRSLPEWVVYIPIGPQIDMDSD